MDLSLVIPCFDEAERIDACLEAATSWLDARGGGGEVIVVDDGSRDGTADRVRAWSARRADVRLIAMPKNRGKGAAVREGVLAAAGDVVAFFDADLAVGVEHLGALLSALEGHDAAVGCRHIAGASVTKPQGRLRRWLGRRYLGFARWLLRIPASDVTCGFKAFRRRVAVELFRGARCRRWGFDAEVLHLAAKAGFSMAEVPVTWHDGTGSRVRVGLDVLRSLKELLGVRWRSWLGAYDVAPRDAERAASREPSTVASPARPASVEAAARGSR